MFLRRLLTTLSIIMAMGLPAAPVMAQDGPTVDTGARDPFAIGERGAYFRNWDSALTDFARESDRQRAERLRADDAAGRALAARAGVTCQISEAILLGRTDDGLDVYEAACGTEPGYMLTASTPPVVTSCIVANTAAAHALAADPTARAPGACTLPSNLNVDAVMAAYAREAGVTCLVDEGRAIGQVGDRAIYEIGCAGRDGYRITPGETGWDKVSCLVVVNAGASCAFTTPAEQYATLQALLEGTDGAACVVDGGRYMGASANGTYYEAKCSGAEGFIFRVKDGTTEAFRCADAQGVAGGCRLTQTAAAAD